MEAYSLDEEDVAIYSDAEGVYHFSHRREWPDKTLKRKATQALEPQSDETINSLPQVHHIQVDILVSMGVDACREDRLSKAGSLQVQPSIPFVALAATTPRSSRIT